MYNEIGKHATTVQTEDGIVQVTYHSTVVIRWDIDNHIVTLDSGGWETVTTKQRMNQVARQFGLEYTVFQKNYVWHVDVDGQEREFVDGMSFSTKHSE